MAYSWNIPLGDCCGLRTTTYPLPTSMSTLPMDSAWTYFGSVGRWPLAVVQVGDLVLLCASFQGPLQTSRTVILPTVCGLSYRSNVGLKTGTPSIAPRP